MFLIPFDVTETFVLLIPFHWQLGTQQSFPLTDCEPIAFYPPIVSDHADSENADTAQPAAIQPESQGELGVGDRHITSRVNVDEISPHSRPVPVQDRLKLEVRLLFCTFACTAFLLPASPA